MKTIGVLGGLGPEATMDFEARIHAAARGGPAGLPRLVVYYHQGPPVVTRPDGSTVIPPRLDPRLLEAARRLGAWADFLVMPAHGVHRWQAEIAGAAGRPVLSMRDLALDEIGRRGWRSVGLLTFFDPAVYQEPLAQRGLRCDVLDAAGQAGIDDAVRAFRTRGVNPDSTRAVAAAVSRLRDGRPDGILLGCTELPLILGPGASAPDLFDPVPLLAEAALARARD